MTLRKSSRVRMPSSQTDAGGKLGSGQKPAKTRIEYASQWRLMWIKFRRHRTAMVCGVLILLLYLTAIFAEFVAPYDPGYRHEDYVYAPPMRIHFVSEDGFQLRPFVYGYTSRLDPDTFERVYEENTAERYDLYLFVRGQEYKLWGLFRSNLRLFGTKEGVFFPFGTDITGRDMFSRIIHGGRISMSIGLIGVFVSFILGLLFGGLAGYYGGAVDTVISRTMELIRSFPQIPLWMAFSAALPSTWSALQTYLAITLILSMIGWTNLARVARGKVMQVKNDDFVTAARISGAGDAYIVARHLVPSFLSHSIAAITLAVPQMILAETALSFLGVGLRPPVISWGVLLRSAQNIHAVVLAPWLLIPALFVVVFVLAYNFLGDGLRDAADPYSIV